MSEPSPPDYEFDVFISYASEDRGDFVQPLFDALEQQGVKAWIDYGQIKLGDSPRQRIDEGLVRSRFGVIVLSPHSLDKFWPNLEWDGLLVLEDATGSKRILPVTHGLSHAELTKRSPLLGGRLSAASSEGIDALVVRITDALRVSPTLSSRQATLLYAVPRQQPGFVGRVDDLERVRQAVLRGDTTVSASISGLAGVGKTALATELAHRLAQAGEFPGGIFWLEAENTALDPVWASDGIGGQLAGSAPMAERSAETVRRISRMKANVLLVLDNVSDWSAASRPGPLPQGKHVHLLLTTREAELGGRDFHQVPLDVLDQTDARELLLGTAGRDIEPGVDELLAALDGHALAIELAGAYLHEEGTAQAYLSEAEFGALEEAVSGRVRYEKTTTLALAAIWERMSDGERAAWCRAACFEPESVGLGLSDAVGVDDTARRALRRFHLITTHDDAATDGRWRMHRLVRAFGQADDRGAFAADARDRFTSGCREFAARIDLSSGFQLYRPKRIHLDAELARILAAEASAEDARFLDRIATGRQSSGELPGAASVFRVALEVSRRVLGEEHPDTLTSMSNLALTLEAQGDLAGARELVSVAVDSAKRTLGPAVPVRVVLEAFAEQLGL